MNFGRLSGSRENNFNVLRLILAALVVYSHSYQLVLGEKSGDQISRLTRGQASAGAIAVDMFFAISGFLVAKSFVGSVSSADFLRKRVLRIYPGFIVATLFCALLVGPIGARSVSAYFSDLSFIDLTGRMLTLRALSLPETFSSNPLPLRVNGSFWTILPEFTCYLLVGVLGVIGAYRRRVSVVVLFGAALLGYQLLNYGVAVPGSVVVEKLGGSEVYPRLLVNFLAGISFYAYRDRIPFSSRLFVLACGALAVSAATEGLRLLMPILGTYALFFLAFQSRIKLHNFGRTWDLSYGVYLYGFPVQQLLLVALGSTLHPWVLFGLALPATCVFAAISWRAVERPFIQMKSRSWRSAPQPTGSPAFVGRPSEAVST